METRSIGHLLMDPRPRELALHPIFDQVEERATVNSVGFGFRVGFPANRKGGVRVPVKQPKFEVNAYLNVCGFDYMYQK